MKSIIIKQLWASFHLKLELYPFKRFLNQCNFILNMKIFCPLVSDFYSRI